MRRFPIWNPTTGCVMPSPTGGCAHCYAIQSSKRGNVAGPADFSPTFHPKRLEEPGAIKTPSVFRVCDTGDPFAPGIRNEEIFQIFDTMMACDGQGKRPRHAFLVTTRHLSRAYDALYNGRSYFGTGDWPCNVWLGTSVSTTAEVEAASYLMSRFAQWHMFLIMAPLLEPVEIYRLLDRASCGSPSGMRFVYCAGEVGQKSRPCPVDGVRHVRDACLATATPFVFGGWGDLIPDEQESRTGRKRSSADKDKSVVATHTEFGPYYRIRNGEAGARLDGKLFDEFPNIHAISWE